MCHVHVFKFVYAENELNQWHRVKTSFYYPSLLHLPSGRTLSNCGFLPTLSENCLHRRYKREESKRQITI